MKLDKTKNTLRSTFWGFVNQIIQNILPFFTRTLLIKLLGAEYLGLNSLFSSILQVLNLAEAGFSVAIVFSMYKPIAEDDDKTICALLALYRKIYRIIGTLIGGIGLLLLPFLPRLIRGDYPADVNIYLLYSLYLANTALSYFLFAYKTSLFSAFQRNDVVSKVSSVLAIVQPALQIVLLLFFRNLIIYTIVIPCITILKNLIISVLATRTFPQYTCRGTLAHSVKLGIYKKVLGLFIAKLSQTTGDSLNSIFISTFIGLTPLTIYSNYFYIMNAIHGFLRIILTSLAAGVGNSIASETVDKNHELFSRLTFLYATLAGWCTNCFICLYQPFMYIWVGEALMMPFPTVLLLCTYFYTMTMNDVKGIFSGATGLWWEERYSSIAQSIANVVLNYFFIRKFGIFGIILATMVTHIFINFGYNSSILFKFYFKSRKRLAYFYLSQMKYLLVTACICFPTYFLCSRFFASYSLLSFCARLLICLCVPTALYLAVYHKRLPTNILHSLGNRINRRG